MNEDELSIAIDRALMKIGSKIRFSQMTDDTLITYKESKVINDILKEHGSPKRIERCASPSCRDQSRRRAFARQTGEWTKVCNKCQNECLFDPDDE